MATFRQKMIELLSKNTKETDKEFYKVYGDFIRECHNYMCTEEFMTRILDTKYKE